MTFSEQVQQFFKKMRSVRYGDSLNPSRDWFVLLCILGIAAGASVLWNVWTFERIASGEILGTPSAATMTASNDAFEKVQKQFAERTAQANHYLYEYHFVDPSR